MNIPTPIPVMINGLPGNVSAIIAGEIMKDRHFHVMPFSLTGPEIESPTFPLGEMPVQLIKPDRRASILSTIRKETPHFIVIDFTHPSAVNANAEFYVSQSLPFVMGTTGGDREKLHQTVVDGGLMAVIAPNMAKEIVGFQAMMTHAATAFPDLFKGYTLQIEESHQKGKADTSGTAKAMVSCFNQLGIPFTEEDIVKVRDPKVQKEAWGIPEEHLTGHAWHTYTLTSPDGTATFSFTHNINGREIYAKGTMDAVSFLHRQLTAGAFPSDKGNVFTMMDVLRG